MPISCCFFQRRNHYCYMRDAMFDGFHGRKETQTHGEVDRSCKLLAKQYGVNGSNSSVARGNRRWQRRASVHRPRASYEELRSVHFLLVWQRLLHERRPPVREVLLCFAVQVAADLFDEPPPVARTWPASLPRTCRRPWPLYTSAGISLCATPGGKLQLLALPEKRQKKKEEE